MKTSTLSLATLGVMLAASPALAQTTAAETPAVSSTAAAPGAHLHDGFYLRLATGFGAYNETIRQKGADDQTAVTGIATVSEIAVGRAVRPGVIFGGGVWSCGVLASDRAVRGPAPPSEVIDSQGNFSLIGPFLDYYFDPRRGLHLQGAAGFATLRGIEVQSGEFDRHALSLGGGLMMGFGYEWWVSNEWSLGVLGRITGGFTTGTDQSDTRWFHTVGASPSVLFSGTFN
jgi:hypothetical protein